MRTRSLCGENAVRTSEEHCKFPGEKDPKSRTHRGQNEQQVNKWSTTTGDQREQRLPNGRGMNEQ